MKFQIEQRQEGESGNLPVGQTPFQRTKESPLRSSLCRIEAGLPQTTGGLDSPK